MFVCMYFYVCPLYIAYECCAHWHIGEYNDGQCHCARQQKVHILRLIAIARQHFFADEIALLAHRNNYFYKN